MPRQQTLTSVAAVIVFGLCGALPFYRADGPVPSSVPPGPARSDVASVRGAVEPRLRVQPGESSVPAQPSPVVLLHQDSDRLEVRLADAPRTQTTRTGVKGPPQRPHPTDGIRGHIRWDGRPPTVQPLEKFRQHVVRDGDSFENLAVDFLGTASRAAEIYELNREQPGCERPDFLPVGVELRIPQR